MNRSINRMAAAAAAFAVLASAAAGCSKNGGETKRKTGPAELTILFSSDLLGRIRSCGCTVEDVGGLGRRASYTKRIRATAKNLLVLDAGDAFSLDMGYSQAEAEFTFEGFNIIGLDVFTPGEMEFIFGLPYLQALVENSSFDVVSANIVDEGTGEPVFGKRYVVKELKGGLRVAITGVLDDTVRFPGYIDRSRFRVEPAESTLRSLVPSMRKEADFLILLSHMGKERTVDLLGRVEDFDIAIVGHDKPLIKREERVGRTLLLATGGQGQYIGSMTINLDAEGAFTEGRLRQIMLTSKEHEMDPEIAELFRIYGLPLTDKEKARTGSGREHRD